MVEIKVRDLVKNKVVFEGKSKRELANFINYLRAETKVDEKTTYSGMAYVLQPHYRIIRNGKEIMY